MILWVALVVDFALNYILPEGLLEDAALHLHQHRAREVIVLFAILQILVSLICTPILILLEL